MKKSHRTAMGKTIDMDNLRLANEDTIALGNMKVNARGDELGPGGRVVKTRNQIMDDYYRLNSPMPTNLSPSIVEDNSPSRVTRANAEPLRDHPEAVEPVSAADLTKLKGELANKFANK